MRLFDDNHLNYVRLDDDVSFQVLRTNPKLTTNTKLMYDGENLFMDAYPAAPILSTMEYKHHRVWKTGLFNRDIRNFLLGANTAAYEVGQEVSNTIMLDNFDDQFETMYWCGVESINSDRYDQEMGCIAPLYLRKKRPNYFVIFRIDDPANTNLSGLGGTIDNKFDFYKDIISKSKIVKAFDLREGTPIGDYIKRYVEQKDFKYDQSVYVNFSSHEIYYYGIDKKYGVLTQKVENIENQLLNNDNTVIKEDDWITSGFERNNLIFPYIINFEFLFDDKETDEFTFSRYFGIYCNDIDLYDLDVTSTISNKDGSSTIITKFGEEDAILTSNKMFYYIKDKYDNIYSAKSSTLPGFFNIPQTITGEGFKGFEYSSISAHAEPIVGLGSSYMVLKIENPLENGDEITIQNTINSSSASTELMEELSIEIQLDPVTFLASNNYPAGDFYGVKFSCKGTTVDNAAALANVIKNTNSGILQWITAYNIEDNVVIQAIYPGANMNDMIMLSMNTSLRMGNKISFVTGVGDDGIPIFQGGTDYDGCLFKVYTSDKDMFFDDSGEDRDKTRYFKCGYGRNNAAIIAVMPYITDDRKIDPTYSLLVTDENGRFVNVSKTELVEIVDKFYPKLGVLSMFPVKDFDFDTVNSAYGEYSLMDNELKSISLASRYVLSDIIPYGRFYYNSENKIDNEYSYYVENIIPELATLNKTVPFVNKWGYIDDSKDSCENPYRLNTSKIFEACNFSANTYMQKCDIMEYTHSMPYYATNKKEDTTTRKSNRNEYQYIPLNNGLWTSSYDTIEEFFSQKKVDGGQDPFDLIFGDVSMTQFTNKRFNKKYSRFLLGDNVVKSSTLFRGVKFEITELKNGQEVNTGKYNDYRFTFVYVPVQVSELSKEHPVRFIKNDDYKFIVGIIYFDVKDDLNEWEFNKAYVYGVGMDAINMDITNYAGNRPSSGGNTDSGTHSGSSGNNNSGSGSNPSGGSGGSSSGSGDSGSGTNPSSGDSGSGTNPGGNSGSGDSGSSSGGDSGSGTNPSGGDSGSGSSSGSGDTGGETGGDSGSGTNPSGGDSGSGTGGDDSGSGSSGDSGSGDSGSGSGEITSPDSYTIDFRSTRHVELPIVTSTPANDVISNGLEYVTDTPFTPIHVDKPEQSNTTFLNYYNGFYSETQLSSGYSVGNKKMIINLSELGKIYADKIIVSCVRNDTRDGDYTTTLSVNNSRILIPAEYHKTPTELTFPVSPNERLENITLNIYGAIMIEYITVVKHN